MEPVYFLIDHPPLALLAWSLTAYVIGTHTFLFDAKKTLGKEVSLRTQFLCFFLSPISVPGITSLYILAKLISGPGDDAFPEPDDHDWW